MAVSRIGTFFRAPAAEEFPLKVAFERKPEDFLHFYQSSLVLSLALVFARLPIIAAAMRWWSMDLGRPLALWLLIDAGFAFMQVPLRAGLLAYLPWPTETPLTRLASSALPVLSSRAAMLSKRISTAHFVWNLIGVLWGLEARSEGCPLRTLTRFVVAVALVRTAALLAFYHFRVCRPPQLAVIRYSSARAQEELFGETSCAVCLNEFCEHQQLRQFSCRHAFCTDCADRWLQVRRVCPVCLRPT